MAKTKSEDLSDVSQKSEEHKPCSYQESKNTLCDFANSQSLELLLLSWEQNACERQQKDKK